MTRHRLTWLASEDGIAHLHTSAHTTACGARAILMRWAWPETSRCPRCLAARDAAAPLPETPPTPGGTHRVPETPYYRQPAVISRRQVSESTIPGVSRT